MATSMQASTTDHVQIPASLRVFEAVSVPRSTFSPCQQLRVFLMATRNPLVSSSDLGYSMYRHCVLEIMFLCVHVAPVCPKQSSLLLYIIHST